MTDGPRSAPATDGDGTAGRRPPEERGRTDVSERALRRLAEHAALEVPGSVRSTQGPSMTSPLSGTLPRAHATTAGDRVRLRVDVAAVWGEPLPRLAAETRRHLRERVSDLTGKRVDTVDVTVASVLPEHPATARARASRVA